MSTSNGHKPKGHRAYSDKQIAEALTILKSCNGNMLQASRESGVPRKTLESWAKAQTQRIQDTGEDLAEIRQISDQTMIAQLESLIGVILTAAPGKIPDAPFGQTMTGLGIALDKRQLLKGLPTQIQATNDASVAATVREFARKYKLSVTEARDKIVANMTNPDAIAALEACPLASEEAQ